MWNETSGNANHRKMHGHVVGSKLFNIHEHYQGRGLLHYYGLTLGGRPAGTFRICPTRPAGCVKGLLGNSPHNGAWARAGGEVPDRVWRAAPGPVRLLRNSRKTERGAISSWCHLVVRAAPFAPLKTQ